MRPVTAIIRDTYTASFWGPKLKSASGVRYPVYIMSTAAETTASKASAKPAAQKNEFLEHYKALGKNIELLVYTYGLAVFKDIGRRYASNPYSVRDNFDAFIKSQTSASPTSKIGKVEREAGMTISVMFDGLVEEVKGVTDRTAFDGVGAARITDSEDAEIRKAYPDTYPSEVARLLITKRIDALSNGLDDVETHNGLHYSRVMISVVKSTRLSPTLTIAPDHKEYFRKLLETHFKDMFKDTTVLGTVYGLFDAFLRALAQRMAPIIWHQDCNVSKNLILGVIDQCYPLTDDYINDIGEILKKIAEQTPKKPSPPRSKKGAAKPAETPATTETAPPVPVAVETK